MTTPKKTTSDIEIPVVALPQPGVTSAPGQYPFTRGIYPDMYRGRLWTMRQYAGFGTASETNLRFKYLLERGQTGLSVAFDLATQIGYDSDHSMARGEVGRVGVAIDSLADMERLFDGIPLDKVSTSMTINATAIILLALYIAVGRKQGVSSEQLAGTVQNDILKEFIARGTYIYPPGPSMRIVTDIFAYGYRHLPRYNVISISGYHIREAGATAVQEVAFTLSNAVAYVKAAVAAGLPVDQVGPRLSFFFAAHNNLFEEVAKFRAARTLWAQIMREKFGARDERSWLLRFHTQTGGSTLTAQQPENNIIRTTLQALAALMGGTQSLHTNAFDEALGLPTEKSAEIALRTQQILAYESGAADSADPLGGSYLIEHLTAQILEKTQDLVAKIESFGGAVQGVETGYFKNEIERSAYLWQQQVEREAQAVVGVNRYHTNHVEVPDVLKLDPELERRQIAAVQKLRAERNAAAVRESLAALGKTARDGGNLVYPVLEAAERYATVGEIADTLRNVFGEHHDNR